MRIAAIIPVYNGKRFLRGAVESVAAQSVPPDELLVIDDGSTDDSLSELEHLTTPFPVKPLRQENRGQSAARNLGAENTDCELLAFLDQDDRWHVAHLERLAQPFAQEPALGWTYSNVDEIDETGRLVRLGVLDHLPIPHPLTALEQMLRGNMHILPSASVIRRSAFVEVHGFDERLSGYEDDDLFLRLFRRGFGHVYLQEPLTDWRVWPNSAAHSDRMARSERIYAEKLIAEFQDAPHTNGDVIRNLVAPRFFSNAMVRYQAGISEQDWDTCSAALRDLQRYFPLTSRHRKLELELKLMQHPRRYAFLKKMFGRLPPRCRSMIK